MQCSPPAAAYDNSISDLSEEEGGDRRGRMSRSFNFSWCLMHISLDRRIVVRHRLGQLFLTERDGSSTRETMISRDVNG